MNITATLDLPYLRELALNMIASVTADPESVPDESVRNNVLGLEYCVDKYLTSEYIEEKLAAMRNVSKQSGQVNA